MIRRASLPPDIHEPAPRPARAENVTTDREPRPTTRGRALQWTWRALLALVLACALTLWAGLFVGSVTSAFGVALDRRLWLTWNVFVLIALWIAILVVIRRRSGA